MFPKAINMIFQRFNEIGKEVYLVGGCVRDFLLGRPAKDYDMASPLRPDEVLDLFSDYTCFTLGKKFGTIGILTDIGVIELTSYRIDGVYKDGRKPSQVEFSLDIKEDLARRDFTINAMAFHPDRGLLDPYGGREDLKKKRIATVGKAKDRFEEDSLRMLRGIRFMGQLGFTIDAEVEEAIRNQAPLIKRLSPERIRDEMDKMLMLERPSICLGKLLDLGLLAYIYPDLMATVNFDQRSSYHDKTLFEHICCVVDQTPAKLPIRIAALFHDIMKPQTLSIDEETGQGHFYGHDILGAKKAAEILRAYHQPKALIDNVSVLIAEHMKVHEEMTDRALRRQIKRVGSEHILDLYDLIGADMACTYQGRPVDWIRGRKERIALLLTQGGIEKDSLVLKGHDIINMGIPEGPLVGHYLKILEDFVLDDPQRNQKELLETYIKEKMKEDRNKPIE